MQSCSGCDQAEAHELTRGQTHAHAHARTKALRHVQAMIISPFITHAKLKPDSFMWPRIGSKYSRSDQHRNKEFA